MSLEEADQGKAWVENLIRRLARENGFELTSPFEWHFDMDHYVYWLRAGVNGSEKHWSFSAENLEDCPNDRTVQRNLERPLTQYFIPDTRPSQSARSDRELHNHQAPAADPGRPGEHDEWDVFICHASEDKESFVRPLAEELRGKGLLVWYDEFTLKVGDSLRRSIDRGLSRSRFGVVVLSPDFFQKGWPQYELDGLATREISGQKVILPVWHNVTRQDVEKYSPSLAGRYAALSSDGLSVVVDKLLDAMGFPMQEEGRASGRDALRPAGRNGQAHPGKLGMDILRAVFSKDFNAFILIIEIRNQSPDSQQLIDWTLEFPDLRVQLQGGPGPRNFLPGAEWLPSTPFDIPGRKIRSGAVFFPAFPSFKRQLPAEPLAGKVTARLFPAGPLMEPVKIQYIKIALRNHPKLSFNGTPSWPPQWLGRGLPVITPIGEVGVLKAVRKMPPQYPIPDHLVLDNEYQSRVFQGDLRADDHEFLAMLYEKLKSECIGWTMQQVGSLELPR